MVDKHPDVAPYVAFIAEAFLAIRPIVTQHFRQDIQIETKDDATPVTIADRLVEEKLRELIRQQFPSHCIIGEEFGADHPIEASDFIWFVDPIDGTKAFIHGLPTFGSLLGLQYKGETVLGGIYQPYNNDMWIGGRWYRTELNGKTVKPRQLSTLSEASFITTSPDYLDSHGERYQAVRQSLQEEVKQVLYGGSCYASGLMASGFIDVLVSAGLKPWDYVSRQAVIEGAGGIMTNWDGAPLTGQTEIVLAANNHNLHTQAKAIIDFHIKPHITDFDA